MVEIKEGNTLTWLRTCVTRASTPILCLENHAKPSNGDSDTLMIRGVRSDGQLFLVHLPVSDPRATPEGIKKLLNEQCLGMEGKIVISDTEEGRQKALDLYKGNKNWIEE